jgi:hypothetical protein
VILDYREIPQKTPTDFQVPMLSFACNLPFYHLLCKSQKRFLFEQKQALKQRRGNLELIIASFDFS